MGVFNEVGQFFGDLWSKVLKPDSQKAHVVIGAFFHSAEAAVASELGVEGLKIVTDGVSAAELAGGTGTEKLIAALKAIASDLTSAEILNVAQNTINVAIEAAVAQMKSAQAQTASSTTGSAS